MSSLVARCCATLLAAVLAVLGSGRLPAQETKPSTTPAAKPAPAPAEIPPHIKQVFEHLQAENARLEQHVKDLGQLSSKRRPGSRTLSSTEASVLVQLDRPTVVEFIETPLQDVADYLKDYHKIEIQIDKRALEDSGVGTDTPITCNLRGVKLRSALAILLRAKDLDWIVEDEVLVMTTRQGAETHTEVRTYDVSDLVTAPGSIESLAEVVRAAIHRPRQRPAASKAKADEAGGCAPEENAPSPSVEPAPPSFVMPFRNMLVIRDTQRNHEAADELLEQLRLTIKAQASPPAGAAPQIHRPGPIVPTKPSIRY